MKELFNDYVNSIDTYIMFRIKQEAQRLTPELISRGRKPISLSMGAPVEPPPQYIYDKLRDALAENNIHSYSTPKGEQYLLDAISVWMKKRFNVEIDNKNEICSLIGSKEGIANIIRALITPTTVEEDKEFIFIPDPGYASYSQMLKVSGGKGYSIPLLPSNNYMPDLNMVWDSYIKDGYKPEKAKALIINYPNNPLGAVANIDYYKHVVEFCKKHNLLLISDAAYVDMTFENQPKCPSIFEVEGAKEIAVEFFSFSKPYSMTGWRIGWVCGNAEAVGIFSKLKSTIDSGIFKAIQKTAAQALASKECDEYVKEANKRFERKQKIMLDGFRELGWNIDKLNPPKATFYLWLPIPERYNTSEEFTSKVLETSGVLLVPGTAFGTNGEGWFRISIVASDDELKEVIRRFKEDGFTY